MKSLVYVLGIALFIIGCSSMQSIKEVDMPKPTQDTIRIANDSLEYEIIIIELGFNAWLATQPPRSYYSLPVLERRNRFSVATYNRRVIDSRYRNSGLYEQQINYDPTISYGLEVNYLLFNYFKFFEERFSQKLR